MIFRFYGAKSSVAVSIVYKPSFVQFPFLPAIIPIVPLHSYTLLKMFSSTSSKQASLPTFVRCKATQRGLKIVQNIRQQEPSTKSPADVNVTVKARRPPPVIAPVFVGRFAAQEAALKVEVLEQILTPVSLAQAQRQIVIALDCLEGKRPENLATSSDWDTLVFLEDIGEMTTAVPVVRSAFSMSVSRFRKFVDEIQ